MNMLVRRKLVLELHDTPGAGEEAFEFQRDICCCNVDGILFG